MKPIQVGLLGIGTVGSGVFKVLERNRSEILRRAGRDIRIAIDVGVGRGKATVWTGDLTHRYIDINGSYRS